MKITNLTLQKSKDRVNMFLNNEFCMGLPLEIVMHYKLKKDMEIDDLLLESLKNEQNFFEVKQKAIKYVSNRLKTQKEVFLYLTQKGYEKDIINYAIKLLIDYKLIDDAHYIEAYINSHPNYGKKMLFLKLLQKGIAKEQIEKTLNFIKNETDKIEELAYKYLKNKTRDSKTSSKLYRFLISRGFSTNDVSNIIKKLFKEQNDGSWD